jgi:TonB family protein
VRRPLGSALTFSLGVHLVLIFGFLVSPPGKETLREATRSVTILLGPATTTVPETTTSAQANQLGRAATSDRPAALTPSAGAPQQTPGLNNASPSTPKITLQSVYSDQHMVPIATLEAEYIRRWQIAIEQFGNTHYRDAAKRHGDGDVRLRVRLDSGGALRGIQVLSSSGKLALDRAAIATVERLAPFDAFPSVLANSVTELDIIRTWQFRN